jgi:hypothetical protein
LSCVIELAFFLLVVRVGCCQFSSQCLKTLEASANWRSASVTLRSSHFSSSTTVLLHVAHADAVARLIAALCSPANSHPIFVAWKY